MKTFIGLLFTAVALFSCTSKQEIPEKQQQTETSVDAYTIQNDSFSIPVQAVGALTSRTQSNLSFLTGGIIASVAVSEGEKVKKGQELARLDMTEIDSRVKQASLGLEKAQRDFRRVKNLYEDTVVTLEQYQNAKTALDLALSNEKIARFNRKNSLILAPSDGKIIRQLKERNEIVAPGYPVFVFASTEAAWVLKVNLSDKDIVRLSPGDSAQVSFDAWPNRTFHARVSEIAAAASPLSGTFSAELELKDLPDQLVTGLIGKGMIYPPSQEYILIPPEALLEAMGNQGIVFLIVDNTPVKRKIILGEITSRGIIVLDGLKPGDVVVAKGNAWLREGESLQAN